MDIKKINLFTINQIKPRMVQQNLETGVSSSNLSQESLLNELDNIGRINFTGIANNNYSLNLSLEDLQKRTSKDYFATFEMLDVDAPEYTNLADGDKQALKHLVKAADIIDKIQLELDSPHNVPFSKYLETEIAKGNEAARLTKELFDGQKGVSALDRNSNMLDLAKGITQKDGKGYYPQDLDTEEFHSILIKMLKDGKSEEVKKILNQRTVVERKGNELVAIDYVDKFKDKFELVADELEKAAKVSTNADFNEYLRLQAIALRKADPMLDAYADVKWATLQDTPLEFSIPRENYEDEMTSTVLENSELKALLDKNGITPIPKDTLGARVGIVNKQGTQDLLDVKNYLQIVANNMPFSDEYTQNISEDEDAKQTMLDVDLVYVSGETGSYRGGVTIAENLPNDDKLSLSVLDGGRRNVYHRQIRMNKSADAKVKLQKKLDKILNPELHKYYNDEADHWFTIWHENGHSMGPIGTEALGKYQAIIEENKADMVAIGMLDVLVEAGMYTPQQRDQLLVTFAVGNMQSAKPQLSEAHWVRAVMQNNYLIKEGAISISKDGVLDINIDKMIPAAKKMLREIIQIQKSGDFEKAEKYINENFVWTPEMEAMAKNLNEVSKTLNAKIKAPLGEKLLREE